MKAIFLLFIVTNLFLSSFSQLTKKNWLVGGSGKFYSYKTSYRTATYNTDGKYTDIYISPNVGYFVADKLAFGLRPSFSSSKGEITSPGGGRTNTRRYSLGPLGRFYFLSVDKAYNLLVDVDYQYGQTTLDNKKVGHFTNFSAMFGPAIYFNNCIALEFLFGYNSSAAYDDDAIDYKQKGMQVSIGFQIHLEK
jgi:hypothetical protein